MLCGVLALLYCLASVSGAGHLIDSNVANCTAHDYDRYNNPQSNDTCCHHDCENGTCSGATADSCVGKCNSWIEGQGPVMVLRGRAIEVEDDDHGTGSTIMSAIVVVNDAWPDREKVKLDVVLPLHINPMLKKEYFPLEGYLKIEGEASTAVYAQILNSMTYDNKAVTPDKRDRIICFWVYDGKHRSEMNCVKVNVTVVNNHPPTVSAVPADQPYKEGSLDGVHIVSSLTIDDPDHPDIFFMHGAMVTVEGGDTFDEVSVNVSMVNTIAIVGVDGWNQTVMLTGPASISDFEEVLSTAKYRSTDGEPKPGQRKIRFTVNDGIHTDSTIVEVTVENINDSPPTIDPGITTESFVEDPEKRARVHIAPLLVLDDPDKNGDYIENVTVEICQAGVCGQQHPKSPDVEFEELELKIAPANGLMVMFFDDADGNKDKTRLRILGRAPKGTYQNLLRHITYYNNRTNISCPIRRYILITANDGRNEGDNFAHISIQFRNNHPPMINADMRTYHYTEGGPAVGFTQTVLLSDQDERCSTTSIKSAKFRFHAPNGIQEKLSVNQTLTRMFGVNATLTTESNGYVVLMLTGIADLREYQAILRTATYVNLADEPNLQQRNVEASVNDGDFESNVLWFNITIVSVNDKPPVLELLATNYTYVENGAAVRFGVSELSDGDSNVCDQKVLELRVTITPIPDGDQESVSFNRSLLDDNVIADEIEGGFVVKAKDVVKGASLELFKILLGSVTYDNTADEPRPRAEPTLGVRHIVFKFKTNIDKTVDSDQITEYNVSLDVRGVNDNAPDVDLNGAAPGSNFSTSFTEEGIAVNASSGLAITDIDMEPNTLLNYALIKVVNGTSHDKIRVSTYGYHQVNVTEHGTGYLEISGRASRQVYSHILGSATYQNTADEPSRLIILIEFQVRDEENQTSRVATTVVTIIEVCDLVQFEPRNMSMSYAANFSEQGQTPVQVVADDFVLDDDDAINIVRGTITIVNATYGERLRVLDNNGEEKTTHESVKISFSWGVLTFSGTASLDTYKELIRWVRYDDTNPCPPSLTRLLYFNFTDECGSQNPPAMTVITILPFNNPPSLDLDGASTDDPVIVPYVFFGVNNRDPTPKPVFPRATLTDCDSPYALEYLNVTIKEASNIGHERMIFYLDGTNLTVTNTTDSTEFKVTYTIMPIIPPTAVNNATNATVGTPTTTHVRPEVFQWVLGNMTYINTATKPFENDRKITVGVSDGITSEVSEAKAEIRLERIPLNPKLELNQTEFNYIVESTPVSLSFLKGIRLTSGDAFFIHQVEITILNPARGNVDKLISPPVDRLPRFWEAIGNGTSKLVLGTSVAISFAGPDDVQNVLQLVNFMSFDERRHEPRNISVVALDSPTRRAGNTVHVRINVAPLNEPPVVTVISADPHFMEGGNPVSLYSNVTIDDPDGTTLQSVTLTVEHGQSASCPGAAAPSWTPDVDETIVQCAERTENDIRADCIQFTSSIGNSFAKTYMYNATHLIVTVSAANQNEVKSISEYQILLISAQYRSFAIEPSNAARIISLTVMDARIDSQPATISVKVSPRNNNPPNLTISTISVNFTEGRGPVHLIPDSDSISISDPDCEPKVTKAELSLETAGDQEWLAVMGSLPIRVNFSVSNGVTVLTITGEGDYTTILHNVVYDNNKTEPVPGRKNVSFRVFDGENWSNKVGITIVIININDSPPSVDLDTTKEGTEYSATYEEEASPVNITSDNVQVKDPDSGAMIHSVKVYLDMVRDGNAEVISSNKSYSAVRTGNMFMFSFPEPRMLSETEDFLESLQYRNSHTEPTPGDRFAKIKLNDGVHDSNEAVSRIRVVTKNDQPPVFSQNYTASVQENSPEGTFVVRVQATDADSHPTNITYSISGGDPDVHFKIDSDGNITTTNVSLDREQNEEHTLTVMASDGMFYESTSVHITILDVDDNCPTFRVKSYQAGISSSSLVGFVVVSLDVTDPDKMIVFPSVISGGNEDSLFNISGGSKDVSVAKNLTGFAFTSHTLTITVALPGCSDSATVNVVIFSSDAKDEFQVHENSPSGTEVGKIIADDNFPDAEYTIILPLDAPFIINNSSVITTTELLDRETDPSYTLIVELIVQPAVAINFTIKVDVIDTNDNAPVFKDTPYRVSVVENEAREQSVAQVNATDEDIGANGNVMFSLPNTTAFNITSDGEIVVNGAIDYEVKCVYEFEVLAIDGGAPQMKSTTQVIVDVTDVNEFAPEFQPGNYSVTVPESLRGGASVIQVSAVDRDRCPGQAVPPITYAFIGPHLGFSIHQGTGQITVDGSLTPGLSTLTVQASDGKGKMSNVSVEISVTVVTNPIVDLNGSVDGINNHVVLSESPTPGVVLASAAIVTLAQGGNIERMTATITNPVDGDSERLVAAPPSSSIEVIYDSITHVLTLQGSASTSDYQAALRTVKYVNEKMTKLLDMSVESVRMDRVIKIIAVTTTNASSEEATATVSFDRNCSSSVEVASAEKLDQLAVCVVISGDLTIKCTSTLASECDILELVMLSDLREVTGRLTIQTTKVESLAGLENVRLYGSLSIVDNTELTTTDQLRRNHPYPLEVSHVTVVDCDLLDDLSGLRGIQKISGDLMIKGNAKATPTGLANLTYVKGDVTIEDNKISTLGGLGMLQSIGGSLTIATNSLTSLNGLRNLTTIGGDLIINGNNNLECVSTLQCPKQRVESVGGKVWFLFNDKACFEVSFWETLVPDPEKRAFLFNGDTSNCDCDC